MKCDCLDDIRSAAILKKSHMESYGWTPFFNLGDEDFQSWGVYTSHSFLGDSTWWATVLRDAALIAYCNSASVEETTRRIHPFCAICMCSCLAWCCGDCRDWRNTPPLLCMQSQSRGTTGRCDRYGNMLVTVRVYMRFRWSLVSFKLNC